MNLKKLMTGANPQSVMLEQTRGLKAKWEKTGLLEGVKSETTKHGMAVILENQAKQLLDEATKTGASSGSEEWAGVALPLVRRIFGSIAAKEFVSVQPMNLPSGLIFYMDFKYSTDQAGSPAFSGSSLFGKGGAFGKDSLDSNATKLGSTQYAEEGLYGAGRFGYTINDSNVGLDATVATASWVDVNFDADLSASLAAGKLKKVTVATPADADFNGVRAFEIVQSGSATAGDAGIVVDRGSDAAGNIAYGFDSTTDRWGYQSGLVDTTNALDPTSASGVSGSFAVYSFTEAAHGATKPITGEFAVVGSQYLDAAGNFWVYTV